MFNTIKSKVDLLEVISKDLDLDLKEAGTDTFAIVDEQDQGGCPFCGHMDCFKIKSSRNPEDYSDNIYHCFSCDSHGDVIQWRSERKKISLVEAARELAKEYSIELPRDFNPTQDVFTAAANYYRTCFLESCNSPQKKLSGMTPMEYQTRVRKHSVEALEHFQVGWSDGGLIEFLESLGYDPELLLEAGLKHNKTGKDFLPNDCFIYPHICKGKVSHFTFKDPNKKIAYQLPNKFVLNGTTFYGQDSTRLADSILIVEGENDVISSWENSDPSKLSVIGTIGQISGSQLDWLRENLSSKHIVTAFDPDAAGDKYREKMEKIKGNFKSLTHVLPPEGKDIDDHLSLGGVDIVKFLNDNVTTVKASSSIIISSGITSTTAIPLVGQTIESMNRSVKVEGDSNLGDVEVEGEGEGALTNNSIIEKNGCYYKLVFKDGEPSYRKISNCVIRLLNVFVDDEGHRTREIRVIKETGKTSESIHVNSDTKTSIRSFRSLLAEAADADFGGTDADLSATWELVFSKGNNEVRTTRMVGRVDRQRGWIFRNMFVSDTGSVIKPDDTGITWLSGKLTGLKPESLNTSNHLDGEDMNIPRLNDELTEEEREELTGNVVRHLVANLNDPGEALIMLGWMNACAYSNTIFKMNRNFPMLFVWGTAGQGKGSVCSWIMDLYDLARTRTAVAQIKSGVGLALKAGYYASLPLWVDEIRADKETAEHQSALRDFFDRGSRPLGTKDGHTIKERVIRCCMMFSGEDQFTDPATKERCLVVRLKNMEGAGRETDNSFRWFDENRELLSAVGYKWILESVREDHEVLRNEIRKLDKEIHEATKGSARKSKSWAIVGIFAIRLANKYLPGFDMRKYLYETSTMDSSVQKSESTVAQFFEEVEHLMVKEGNARTVNENHISVTGTTLSIWFSAVYKAVSDSCRGTFPFSRNAVLAAIRDEPYYLKDRVTAILGLHRREVLQIDVSKAPSYIKSIAGYEDR